METKTCLHCGKAFAPLYRVTAAYWAKRQYCSNECKQAAKVQQPGAEIEVVCPECGGKRKMYPSQAALLKTAVCRTCFTKKVEVTCPRCGLVRSVRPSVAGHMRRGMCGKCRPFFDRDYDLTISDTWASGYVFGTMIGDGTLIYCYATKGERRPQGIRLQVTSRAFAEKFLENVTICTGKTAPIQKSERWMKGNPTISMPPMFLTLYTVEVSGREWHEKIAQVKKDKRYELLSTLGIEFKKGLVQGFLDAEGYIANRVSGNGNRQIRFANKDLELLGMFQVILSELGYRSTIQGPYEKSRGVAHLTFTANMEKTQ